MKEYFVSLFIVLGIAVLVGGILTKLGYIPNYLGIEILCLENKALDEIDIKETLFEKPVLYLYPTRPKEVEVKVNFDGNFIATYPEYKDGWKVFAYPNGRLVNLADEKKYSYLFWEGKHETVVDYDLSNGFVVEGGRTALFLQEKLAEIGLIPKEYNEFIVYWLPKMLSNKYNLVHFATKEEYDEKVSLEVRPQPDSVLRVFMVFKPLNKKIDILPQEIKPFKRKGFAVIEWGGAELK